MVSNGRFGVVIAIALCSCAGEQPQQVALLAAGADLEEGVEIEKSQMVEVKVSPSLATPNALKPDALQATVGRRLRISIRNGNLLLASYFDAPPAATRPEPPPFDGPISTLVQKKGRAVTLSVSGGENLRASDRVDILAVVPDAQTKEWASTTQLQNVVVLSPGKVEPVAANEAFPLRRVTFLLLPEEAEVVLLAARIGGLHVTVRNREDIDVMEERGRATINTLLAGERMQALERLRTRVLQRRGPAATANEPQLASPPPPHPMPAADPTRASAPMPAETAPVPAMPGRQ